MHWLYHSGLLLEFLFERFGGPLRLEEEIHHWRPHFSHRHLHISHWSRDDCCPASAGARTQQVVMRAIAAPTSDAKFRQFCTKAVFFCVVCCENSPDSSFKDELKLTSYWLLVELQFGRFSNVGTNFDLDFDAWWTGPCTSMMFKTNYLLQFQRIIIINL